MCTDSTAAETVIHVVNAVISAVYNVMYPQSAWGNSIAHLSPLPRGEETLQHTLLQNIAIKVKEFTMSIKGIIHDTSSIMLCVVCLFINHIVKITNSNIWNRRINGCINWCILTMWSLILLMRHDIWTHTNKCTHLHVNVCKQIKLS